MMKVEQERLCTVLKDTISLLCKNSLTYEKQVIVQGLIAITVDKEDVLVVQVNDHVGQPSYDPCVACGRTTQIPEKPSRRKRSRSASQDSPRKSSKSEHFENHKSTARSESSACEEVEDTTFTIKAEVLSSDERSDLLSDDNSFMLAESEIKRNNACLSRTTDINSFDNNITENNYITGVLDNSHVTTVVPVGANQADCAQYMYQVNSSDQETATGANQLQKASPVNFHHCASCNLNFKSTNQLCTHMRNGDHPTEHQLKPFACPWKYCDKRFKTLGHIKDHYLVHTKEKPYGCKFCEYRANIKSNLVKHIRHKHTHM